MTPRKISTFIGISLLAISCVANAANKPSPKALQHMEQFHLRQAEEKIAKQQLAHAWGDLAYIVAYIPNHQLALRYMLVIAPQIDKTAELKQYFERALAKYPEDKDLLDLHAQVLQLGNSDADTDNDEEQPVS